jgi:serine/threonine protein kinase
MTNSGQSFFVGIVLIYGVTRDLQSAIVAQFKNGGNPRELIKNHGKLGRELIIRMIDEIILGLNFIHIKNYHKNFLSA